MAAAAAARDMGPWVAYAEHMGRHCVSIVGRRANIAHIAHLWATSGGKHCFQRRTGVRWVEAMGRELTIVLQNLDAALKHLPEYIPAEGDAQRMWAFKELVRRPHCVVRVS